MAQTIQALEGSVVNTVECCLQAIGMSAAKLHPHKYFILTKMCRSKCQNYPTVMPDLSLCLADWYTNAVVFPSK